MKLAVRHVPVLVTLVLAAACPRRVLAASPSRGSSTKSSDKMAATPRPGSATPTKKPAKKPAKKPVKKAARKPDKKPDKKPPEVPRYEQVVTAKRRREAAFTSDRTVSVVGRKTLEETAPRTTPEALWDTPGVFVQETNYGGGSPILRGMIGPQVLILVDGVRLNNSVYRTGPLQYLNLIDPMSIQRIEVLRGPGSVLYGSDAMGGVIQVVPLRAALAALPKTFDHSGRLNYRFSSADRGHVVHGYTRTAYGNLGGLASLTARSSNDLTAGRDIGRQPYSGYTHWSALGNVTGRVRTGVFKGLEASVSYLFTDVPNAGRTDKLYTDNKLQMYDNTIHLVYGRFKVPIRLIRTDVRLTVSYQHFNEVKDSLNLADNLVTMLSTVRDRTRVYTIGTDLQLLSRLYKNFVWLQYGGMIYHDMVFANRWSRNAGDPWAEHQDKSYPDDSAYDNFGAFVMAGGRPLNINGHRLELRAGYRFHGMRGEAPATAVLPAVEFSHLGHVFMGSIQYLYRRHATAAVTFSEGFRAPNLNEAVMLGDTGKLFHVPNTDLGPERSDTVEVMTRFRFWRIALGYSVYVSFLRDMIKREETTWQGQTEIDGQPVEWNTNGGKGILWGVEGYLKFLLGRGFSFLFHVTHTWGEEWVDDGPDEPLTRIPPVYGLFRLRYDSPRFKRWRGFAETYIRWAGKQARLSAEDIRDVRIPETGTPGWWTLNIRMGMNVFRRLRLNLAVENLLNKPYKYHASGVYAPSTNAVLSAELFF